IKSLRNSLKGLPVIIVGAGPSLDVTLPFLCQFKGKAVIFAVDSAFLALKRVGITPDYIVSIDPQMAVLKHLSSLLNESVPMIVTPISCHALLRKYKGDKIFLTQEENIYARRIKGISDLGTTKAGGSVSCFALDAAVQMGCETIVLTGLDSSFPYLMAYAKVSNVYSAEGYIIRKKLVSTQDAFGGKVATHQNLYEYLRTIEALIKDSGKRVYNFSPMGAKIEHAENIQPSLLGGILTKKIEKKNIHQFLKHKRNNQLYEEIKKQAMPVNC
ncbi:MAG: DUF115 domain-containing protein, partial [Nitrospinae bacterium]|nr:DUF115 domain-containing protein [Nitrospinota bacterium]